MLTVDLTFEYRHCEYWISMILYNNLQLQCQGTVKSNSSNYNIKSHLKVVHILKFDQIINRLPVTLQLA